MYFIFQAGQHPTHRMLAELSHWIATNINSVSEEELMDIVAALCGLEYSSPRIVQSLEKYIKTHNQVSLNDFIFSVLYN